MKAIYKVLMVLAIPAFLVLYSFSGGSPGGKTGSPGDGSDCTSCHEGNDVQNVGDWIVSDIPEGGYVPGNTYEITAKGILEGVGLFGFEITSENEAGVKKGEFMLTDEVRTQRVGSNAVTHTVEGTKPTDDDDIEWTMKWTAPEAGTGNVRLYAAINAANGNGNNGGDQIFLTMLSVNEDVSISIAENLLKDKIKMYPNPGNNIVNLDLPEGADFYMIDMLGNQITSKVNVSSKETIDISEFENGVYFVQVIHNGESHTSRLIKN